MKLKNILLSLLIIMTFMFVGCSTYLDYPDSEKYLKGGSEITQKIDNLDIEWINGEIKIINTENSNISFDEYSNKDTEDSNMLRYYVSGNTLFIKYGKKGYIDSSLEKKLIVYVPISQVFNSVDIETQSANVYLSNIVGNEIDIETVSGDIDVLDINFKLVELESVSGDVALNTKFSISKLNTESVSGTVNIKIEEVSDIEVDTTSGTITIYLLNFSDLSIESVSGNITINIDGNAEFKIYSNVYINGSFPLQRAGNSYSTLNGKNIGKIETVSGMVSINKR